MSRLRALSLALALSVVPTLPTVSVAQQQRTPTMAGRSPVYAPNGVAATSQPLATSAAIAVLERGGNAFDAAVTAAAVLAVVEPMMTGIGGDMFALAWSAKEKRLVALNASGRAGSLMGCAAQEIRNHHVGAGRSTSDRIRGERISGHSGDRGRLESTDPEPRRRRE